MFRSLSDVIRKAPGVNSSGGNGATNNRPGGSTSSALPVPGINTSGTSDGLAFRTDLPRHLTGPDGFKANGGLHGTHNLNNAKAELDSKGIPYTVTPTGTAGILTLEHQKINPKTGKVTSTTKTVYDPAYHSDNAMINHAQEAGKTAWALYLQNPTQQRIEVTQGGVNFMVYINFVNGVPYIGNVHPIE